MVHAPRHGARARGGADAYYAAARAARHRHGFGGGAGCWGTAVFPGESTFLEKDYHSQLYSSILTDVTSH